MKPFIVVLLLLLSYAGHAQVQGEHSFDGFTVYHSTFNSTATSPDIAALYNLKRANHLGTLNIAAVKDGEGHGSDVLLTGTVTNIMQQQRELEFITVREGDAVYYLAQFVVDYEEFLAFDIRVALHPDQPSQQVTFKVKMYEED